MAGVRSSGSPSRRGAPKSAAAAPAPPAAVTLVTGGDAFLMSRAVRRTLSALQAAVPDADVHRLDAGDPTALGRLPEVLSPSLFSPVAAAVVENLESAPDALVSLLMALAADLGDNRLVVVHSGQKGRKSLDQLRALKPAGGLEVIDCQPVKKGRAMREFLQGEAARSGRRLAPDGAEALLTAVGGDVSLLVAALEQLISDEPTDPLGAGEVATMFTGVAEVSGFSFSDAIWERDAAAAIRVLRWGVATNSLSPPAATGSAAAGLRSLVRVASAPRGLSEADVARMAGVPPFKVRALQAQARDWSPEELALVLVGLAGVDGAVKGGLRPGENLEPQQKLHALESWVRSTIR